MASAVESKPRLARIQSNRDTRIKACELAATVMAGRSPQEPANPILWSLAVFFECYIDAGAEATRMAFGPKPPVQLTVVKNAMDR